MVFNKALRSFLAITIILFSFNFTAPSAKAQFEDDEVWTYYYIAMGVGLVFGVIGMFTGDDNSSGANNVQEIEHPFLDL